MNIKATKNSLPTWAELIEKFSLNSAFETFFTSNNLLIVFQIRIDKEFFIIPV